MDVSLIVAGDTVLIVARQRIAVGRLAFGQYVIAVTAGEVFCNVLSAGPCRPSPNTVQLAPLGVRRW